MVRYDEDGICTRCGLPATGFVLDGVCDCLEREEEVNSRLSSQGWRRERKDRKLQG